VPLHHDRGPIVGLDDGTEVGPEGAFRALLPGEVRAPEAPGYRPLTAPLSDKEQLLPAAVEADRPALGIGEPDAIKRLKPHQLLLQSDLSPVCGPRLHGLIPQLSQRCPDTSGGSPRPNVGARCCAVTYREDVPVR
jgi:hypothetical protein